MYTGRTRLGAANPDSYDSLQPVREQCPDSDGDWERRASERGSARGASFSPLFLYCDLLPHRMPPRLPPPSPPSSCRHRCFALKMTFSARRPSCVPPRLRPRPSVRLFIGCNKGGALRRRGRETWSPKPICLPELLPAMEGATRTYSSVTRTHAEMMCVL